MFLSMIGLLLITITFCPHVAFAAAESVVINTGNPGKIETYQSEVKLQNIPFMKRSVNLTTMTSISFTVVGIADLKKHLFQWFLNGVDISGDVKRYTTSTSSPTEHMYSTEVGAEGSTTVTLHLRNRRLVPGSYRFSLISRSTQASIGEAENFVHASPMLPLFPKVRKVLDGDPLTLHCKVTGYPLPDAVIWKFAHVKPESAEDSAALTDAFENLNALATTSSAYKFSKVAVTNEQLVFEKLPREFSGLYECRVTGANGDTDTTLILVNIKDRWAALWPFIGIVIEVTILVSGILLYERHQMRSRAAKNESVANVEPVSPSAVQQTANSAQHNNIPTADGLHTRDKSGIGDASEDNPDDIRQRNAPQC